MDFLFSSSAACDAVAERAVRSFGNSIHDVSKAVANAIDPVLKDIILRGGVRRGQFGEVTRRVVSKVSAIPGVLNVERHRLSKQNSTNEEWVVRFVYTTSLESEFVEFITCDVHLTRDAPGLMAVLADFRIRGHLLSRYMQRYRRPYTQALQDVMKPLRLSRLLAATAILRTGKQIALPFAGGLMLGRVSAYDGDTVSGVNITFAPDAPIPEPVTGQSLLDDMHLHVEMGTCVDGDSLYPVRERLRDELETFQAKHDEALQVLFDSFSYRFSRVRADKGQPLLAAAMQDAIALVEGRAWQDFIATLDR